ncbi:MAG: hypothetical protein OEY89_09950 [Gammaproteobacteria bacterium]|nr:hypothetical protein [Gammaproteobacteria bacterium]
MKNSSLSMLVFAGYMLVLGFFLIVYPDIYLFFGFEDVSGPWVRTLGYVVCALAFYYFMAVKEQAKNFYRWTVYARMPLLLFFILLVAFDIAPSIMLLLGLWDTCCALWTCYALKHEGKLNEL